MDRGTGKCLQVFQGEGYRNETYRLRSTLAVGDGVALAGAEDGSVFAWDVLTGKLVESVRHVEAGHRGQGSKKDVVSAVAWNQLKKQWASAGADGTVVVWGTGDE